MTETALLQEGVAIFGIALLVGWVFRRLKAPTILGFLFAGLLIGPNTLGWISEEGVARFAELGLVLLLFSIGIELSAATMFRTGSRILLSSIGQVVGTVLLAFPVFWAIGFAPGAALVLGAAVAPSSSPIALKQLSDRGEAGTSIGGVLTGMQLLQDMCVILFMVFLPLFAQGDGSRPTMSIYAIPALVLFGALLPVGRVVLPRIIDVFVRFGGRELLALFAVLMALGGAWLASLTGWPVALGACIAGLVLASADVRHQVLAEITPLRDIFNALFFVSMGMLVDTTLFITHLHWFCLAVAATVLLKPAVAAISVVATGWPSRVGIHVGIGLCTVSEVGYVLAHEAMRLGLISGEWLDVFTTYIVGTMMVGAAAFPAAGTISRVLSARIRRAAEGTEPSDTRADEPPQGHVILVGCGQNGETLARVLKSTRIPFLLIDINPSRIRQAQTDHMPGLVGDATRMSILEHAGLAEARALVVAINDPESTRRIVAQARSRRADLYIIARTRAVQEIDRLTTLGANLVVSTNFEASIEIFARVLREFGIPGNIVEAQIASARAKGYGLLRGEQGGRIAYMDELLKVLQTTVIQSIFLAEASPAARQTIAALNLRARTGVTIIAVVRDGKPTTNPPAAFRLESGDVLVLVGAHAELDEARKLLEVAPATEEQAPPDDVVP